MDPAGISGVGAKPDDNVRIPLWLLLPLFVQVSYLPSAAEAPLVSVPAAGAVNWLLVAAVAANPFAGGVTGTVPDLRPYTAIGGRPSEGERYVPQISASADPLTWNWLSPPKM